MPDQSVVKVDAQVVSAPGAVESRPDSILAIIAAAARDPQVNVETMRALLDMKRELDKLDAEHAFNEALTRLQPKLPRIKKNGSIDLGRGKPLKFAKYEDIDKAIRPLLTAEGLSLSFTSEPAPSGVLMTGILSHVQGHSRRSTMQLPADQGPGRNSLQAIGSSHSYGKRYLVCDMLNIITEGADDDGNKAEPLGDERYGKLVNMVQACEMTGEEMNRFLKYLGVAKTEDVQTGDFDRAMEALSKKLRQKQGGK